MSKSDYRTMKNVFDKLIKDVGDSPTKNLLVKLKKDVFEKFEALKKEVEGTHHQYKSSTPVKDRFVDFKLNDSSNIKMTYRPSNGELLIKVSEKTPYHKIELLEKLGKKIISEIPDELKLTLRGTPHWSETEKGFRVVLADNNKSAYKLAFKN
jgi:hypothetical protein